MYVNLNFSLKNWMGGVFGKWAPPHGAVVLMSRQNTGEICVKQRPAQNFLLVFQSTGGGYDTKHVFGLFWLMMSSNSFYFALWRQTFLNYFSDLSINSRCNCMFAWVFQPATAMYANIPKNTFSRSNCMFARVFQPAAAVYANIPESIFLTSCG